MSCWKLGCRETWAWARVRRPPRTPSRTSPTHSVCGAAILPVLTGVRTLCQQGRQWEGGRQEEQGPLGRPLFMGLAWPLPRAQGQPTGARDAGSSCSLAPRRAACVRGSDQHRPGPAPRGLERVGGRQRHLHGWPPLWSQRPTLPAWMGAGACALAMGCLWGLWSLPTCGWDASQALPPSPLQAQ